MFGALAHTLLSGVAEGRASLCNCSPPAEARPGQEYHWGGCFGLCAAWLVPSS